MKSLEDKAIMLYKLGKLDEAEQLFIEGLSDRDKKEKYLYNLGVINIKKKNFSKALEFIERALEYDEKYEFMFNRAYCYYMLNNKVKAKKCADDIVLKHNNCLKDSKYVKLKKNILEMKEFNSPVKKKVTNTSNPTIIAFNSHNREELIKDKLEKAQAKNDIVSLKKYQRMLSNTEK